MEMGWLREQLELHGMTQKELATTAGMTETMFSNVLAGRRLFKASEVDAIRRAFGFSLPEDQPATVAVAGRVAAGDHLDLVDDFEKGDGLYHIARPSWLPPHGVVAAEISGSSAEPWALEGDVIFWARHAMGVLEEDVGRPVVAKLGDDRIVLKRLVRSAAPDRWTLLSLNPVHPNLVDVEVEWAARVLPPLPRDEVRRA
jgi:transcriptional regulator with XRE-family HTH domain